MSQQKMSQNIFTYATSELSQDAFISLLIAWFDSDDESLKEISSDFIRNIYSVYKEKFDDTYNSKELSIQSIGIKQQFKKIDVYFDVITENDEKVSFVIEDKTWTEPHGDQLERYSKYGDIKILFKTGHITEVDRKKCADNEFYILDISWIYKFLEKYTNLENYILKDFFDFIESNFYKKMYHINTHLKKDLIDWKRTDVKENFVQYRILELIKQEISKYPSVNSHIGIRYTMNGNRCETWWNFKTIDNECHFMIKIKVIKRKHRIRLVNYTANKSEIGLYDKSKYKNVVLEACNNTKVIPSEKIRIKARESELAYLEVSDNLIDDINHIINFIKVFINKL